jgi:hypothetical protein
MPRFAKIQCFVRANLCKALAKTFLIPGIFGNTLYTKEMKEMKASSPDTLHPRKR